MAGVEAIMLMHPAWDVGNAMTLMMHADATWSGPGGWIRTVKRLIRMRMRPGEYTWPSKPWFVLAVPSLTIFVAWPLSGLSFEMASGFVRRLPATGTSPNVTGFSYANFNERYQDDAVNGAGVTWRYALDARVPGKGIIYTPPDVESLSQPYLPKDEGVPRIFLTAQAENPIHGNSWGLALQYNYSIVKDLSEFTLVKYENSSNKTLFGTRLQPLDQNTVVQMVNQSYVANMYAVAEYASGHWPNVSASSRIMDEYLSDYWIKATDCYFNQVENITGDYPGLDDEDVFEMVLWQYLTMPAMRTRGRRITQPWTATSLSCTGHMPTSNGMSLETATT